MRFGRSWGCKMRTRFHCVVLILLALLPATLRAAAKDYGVDLHGHRVRRLAAPGTRVVVVIFAATDCPISNRYVPEISRLAGEFSSQNVRFWWVFPNPDDTAGRVVKHNRDYALADNAETGTLLDRRQALVQLSHATTTPEAAVFAVEGTALREVYHGRIDDHYISLGQQRLQAQQHDLETAISAALAGKVVPAPGGPPVGCSIVYLQK